MQRDIAQFGSAPSWGDGGHRFESCYSEWRYVYYIDKRILITSLVLL